MVLKFKSIPLSEQELAFIKIRVHAREVLLYGPREGCDCQVCRDVLVVPWKR